VSKVSDQVIVQSAEGAGWRLDDLTTAVAVALAESGGDATATHHNTDGSTDYGLWQVNDVHSGHKAPEGWADPATNGRLAHAVFVKQGWHAWSAHNSGRYLLYMGRARVATARYAGGLGTGVAGPDVAGAVGGTVAAAGDAVQLAARGGAWASDPGNWLRVVYVALGAVMVAGAVIVVAGKTLPGAGGAIRAAGSVLR
jgi:hypothetical protein